MRYIDYEVIICSTSFVRSAILSSTYPSRKLSEGVTTMYEAQTYKISEKILHAPLPGLGPVPIFAFMGSVV